MENNYWLNIYNSTIRFIQEEIKYLKDLGYSETLEFRNLDDHSNNDVMPSGDFIGLKSFCCNYDDSFIKPVFQLGISTFEDQNLVRHNELVDHFVQKMLPMETYIVADHESPYTPLGKAIFVDNLTVKPFEKISTRSIQFILVDVEITKTTR